jgi:hypothetical protein
MDYDAALLYAAQREARSLTPEAIKTHDSVPCAPSDFDPVVARELGNCGARTLYEYVLYQLTAPGLESGVRRRVARTKLYASRAERIRFEGGRGG